VTARLRLVFTDDLDEAKGVSTEIGDDGETVILALDGTVRELHLTAAHAARLRGDVEPYLAAGHEPGAEPQPAPAPQQHFGPAGPRQRREIPGTREFYAVLRAWAAEDGTEIETAPGRANTYVYPRELRLRYVTHLAKQAARGGPDGDAARARLAMAAVLGFPSPEEQPGPGRR